MTRAELTLGSHVDVGAATLHLLMRFFWSHLLDGHASLLPENAV